MEQLKISLGALWRVALRILARKTIPAVMERSANMLRYCYTPRYRHPSFSQVQYSIQLFNSSDFTNINTATLAVHMCRRRRRRIPRPTSLPTLTRDLLLSSKCMLILRSRILRLLGPLISLPLASTHLSPEAKAPFFLWFIPLARWGSRAYCSSHEVSFLWRSSI